MEAKKNASPTKTKMKPTKNKYLVFYDVNARDGSVVFGTHPMELSYEDNPLNVLTEKHVPIHKIYCMAGKSQMPDMDIFVDDFNHEEISDQWWSIIIDSTDKEIWRVNGSDND